MSEMHEATMPSGVTVKVWLNREIWMLSTYSPDCVEKSLEPTREDFPHYKKWILSIATKIARETDQMVMAGVPANAKGGVWTCYPDGVVNRIWPSKS